MSPEIQGYELVSPIGQIHEVTVTQSGTAIFLNTALGPSTEIIGVVKLQAIEDLLTVNNLILKELQKLNSYQALITDDEIKEKDIFIKEE